MSFYRKTDQDQFFFKQSCYDSKIPYEGLWEAFQNFFEELQRFLMFLDILVFTSKWQLMQRPVKYISYMIELFSKIVNC